MISIQYPANRLKIREQAGKSFIFDPLRRQWVVLTPEEWVRQNFLQYLLVEKNYPSTMIAVERLIVVNGLKKRFDIVVFKDEAPWMIVECKEMNVPLSEAVLQQVLTYNIQLKVPYLVITNGNNTFALQASGHQHSWLDSLPTYG